MKNVVFQILFKAVYVPVFYVGVMLPRSEKLKRLWVARRIYPGQHSELRADFCADRGH